MASGTLAPPLEAFTAAHTLEFARANDRAKAVRKASRVAAFNGWISALLAACSLPFALLGIDGLIVAVLLAVVAINEFRGRRRLLAFDPTGADLLGWNQLGLLAAIIVYCLWSIYANLTGGNPMAEELKHTPELNDMLGGGSVDSLFRQFVFAFYGLVALLSVAFQGGNAWYYFSRRKYVQACLNETPAWVRELQRAASYL
jgi:hypothetical protein